jgi:hypothetical protein
MFIPENSIWYQNAKRWISDGFTLGSSGCTGTTELNDIVIPPPGEAGEGKTGYIGGLLRLTVVRPRAPAVSPSTITHSAGSITAVVPLIELPSMLLIWPWLKVLLFETIIKSEVRIWTA